MTATGRMRAAAAALTAAGSFVPLRVLGSRLPAPNHWALRGDTGGIDDQRALDSLIAMVVIGAAVVAAYVLVVGTLALMASFFPPLRRGLGSRRLAPRVLWPLLGIGPLALSASPAHAAEPPVMVHLGAATQTPQPAPVMRWLGPASTSAAPSTALPPPATTSPPPEAAVPAAPTRARPATRVVQRGDHLWGIAAETVEDRLGRAPTTREVRDYWRSLIDANRDRLADPTNPDLVFTGQELVLPD